MKLVTYIDGGERTPYGVMLDCHSVSCVVTIAPEHRRAWVDLLGERLECEIKLPKRRVDPVPVTMSTSGLADIVDDCRDRDFVATYAEELDYMCTEDPCGMGVVYLMGGRA